MAEKDTWNICDSVGEKSPGWLIPPDLVSLFGIEGNDNFQLEVSENKGFFFPPSSQVLTLVSLTVPRG